MYKFPLSLHPHVTYFLIANSHENQSPVIQDSNSHFGNVMNYTLSLIYTSANVIFINSNNNNKDINIHKRSTLIRNTEKVA